MLRDLGGWHLLIILGIVVLLFGSTKLPALARGVGQSMRIFKAEVKEPKTDKGDTADNVAAASADTTPAPSPTVTPVTPPVSTIKTPTPEEQRPGL